MTKKVHAVGDKVWVLDHSSYGSINIFYATVVAVYEDYRHDVSYEVEEHLVGYPNVQAELFSSTRVFGSLTEVNKTLKKHNVI